jgi:hypothetical protein
MLLRAITLITLASLVGCGAPAASPPPKAVETTPVASGKEADPGEVPSSERTAAPETADEPIAIECTKPEQFGPVIVSEQQYAGRRGAQTTRFSEARTTKERALEECALMGSLRRLLTLSCDDGSKPFPNPTAAHASRVGNVGPGGRCGSIIDLYRAACPEKTYDVHIDMYVCRDGEWPE